MGKTEHALRVLDTHLTENVEYTMKRGPWYGKGGCERMGIVMNSQRVAYHTALTQVKPRAGDALQEVVRKFKEIKSSGMYCLIAPTTVSSSHHYVFSSCRTTQVPEVYSGDESLVEELLEK